MKRTNRFIGIFLLLFSMNIMGCTDERLPPTKCNTYKLKLSPFLSPGQTINSLRLYMKGVDNEQVFDTTFTNPPDTFEYESKFCGNFNYIIEVDHQQSSSGVSVLLNVNDEFTPTLSTRANGYRKFEGNYFFF